MTTTSRGKPFGRRALRLALLVGTGMLTGQQAPAVRAADWTTVRIDNFSFVPEAPTIKVGTTVVWDNEDDIPHSVVLSDTTFRSKPLDTHDTATFTFAKVGAMDYFCGLHPHMRGRIIVVR